MGYEWETDYGYQGLRELGAPDNSIKGGLEDVGVIFRGAHRRAKDNGFVSALLKIDYASWRLEAAQTVPKLLCLGPDYAEECEVMTSELGIEHEVDWYGNRGIAPAFCAAHDWAVGNGYAAGWPTFESNNNTNSIVAIRTGKVDLGDYDSSLGNHLLHDGVVHDTDWWGAGIEDPAHAFIFAEFIASLEATKGHIFGYPNFHSGDGVSQVVKIRK